MGGTELPTPPPETNSPTAVPSPYKSKVHSRSRSRLRSGSFLFSSVPRFKNAQPMSPVMCSYPDKELNIPTPHSLTTLHFTLDDFSAFLLRVDNSAFEDWEHEMMRPLSEYYISSSHNTYLVGHQLVGESTIEGYIRSLGSGCRSVEVDIWDGDHKPVITHGCTLTGSVLLRHVAQAIAKYAFVAFPYPVIISAKMHTGIKQQSMVSQICRGEFGNVLITCQLDGTNDLEELECPPSPEELKGRVLLKFKNALLSEVEVEGEIEEVDDVKADSESIGKGTLSRTQTIAKCMRSSFQLNRRPDMTDFSPAGPPTPANTLDPMSAAATTSTSPPRKKQRVYSNRSEFNKQLIGDAVKAAFHTSLKLSFYWSQTPKEISAMVLTKMKETAEAYLRKKVTHTIVTVPAYFNDAQRQATKDAGTIAGLTVLCIVNKPTAAAITYGLDKKGGETQIIVYDLGGGTFDVSIDDGVFEVLATAGDTHLGGGDFDNRVIEHFVRKYKKKTGTDVTKNQCALSKLKEVEKAKHILSSQVSTKLEIESFENGNNFSETLTRSKFEELNIDLFRKTMKPVEQVLKDANVKKEDIYDIVLVGGSTRIPKVQQLIKEYFGNEPSKGINPDETVAYDATIQGGILSGEEGVEDVVLIDVCPLTLSIEITSGVFTKLIPRNAVVPTEKSQIFSTAADNQPTDNNLLGKFELSGIPPAWCGVPQIEVTFEIDGNGILKVAAADKGTGKSESIMITNKKGCLSPEEIERMRIEALNGLQNFVWGLKSQLGDQEGLGGKISDKDKKTILATVKDTADWIKENGPNATTEDLEEKLQEVQAIVNPITGKLYGSGLGSGSEGSSSHDEL
ncbi:78 kDa glucose-regulated protein homolog [Rhizoctonia solani]|uniref:78 kDa glucose-regulated protein homolog n=1 Tax=Rhizoctonia solani TaxID=456999 RepID=A0A0K6GA40_9AGAM|nr:78 kDa glucose-regulated protein homolog [Rhizoctonia solani]